MLLSRYYQELLIFVVNISFMWIHLIKKLQKIEKKGIKNCAHLAFASFLFWKIKVCSLFFVITSYEVDLKQYFLLKGSQLSAFDPRKGMLTATINLQILALIRQHLAIGGSVVMGDGVHEVAHKALE